MEDRPHPQQEAAPAEVRRPYKYRLKPPRSYRTTSPFTWLAGVVCALVWIIIILGGIAVLAVYLFFRPRSPRFDVAGVTLNGAYLDTGTFLLNADVTILANFSNHNQRVDITFTRLSVDLYFNGTLIATQGILPFEEKAGESTLRNIHMVASEVVLRQGQAEEWRKAVGGSSGGVGMELVGKFRTRSDLGRFLHFSYWLYSHCSIVVGQPPGGILLSSKCRTKR